MQTTMPLAAMSLLLLCGTYAHAGDERPNIVFFLSDDHRADFLGCAGHPIVKTPVLDQLASKGVRYTRAFVTTSICAASRATLLTGQWERSHGFTFGTPPLSGHLVASSYPAVLRKHGYQTGFVGKLGVKLPPGSTSIMFDTFKPLQRAPYWKGSGADRRHVTDLTGDAAIKFIESQSAQKPFCLSVSFNAAHAEDHDKSDHYPWPEAEDGLYESAVIPPPKVDMSHWKQLPSFLQESMNRKRWHWRWDTPAKYQANVKAYFRLITALDRNIGRVLQAIEGQGWSENTIVIFMGDNGYYKGSRGFAGKWSHFDESLHVPLIVFDPRTTRSKNEHLNESFALNVDIASTIVGAAGLTQPKNYQGQDLFHPALKQRQDFFCEHLFDHKDIPKWEGIRSRNYSYARYFENLPEGEFLHDLKADPLQLHNLATDPMYAEVLNQLRQRTDQLRERYESPARLPSAND